MTAKGINKRMEIEKLIHETALRCVEQIEAARKAVKELDGDGDEAVNRMLELINEED
jgi:hypothetical protein